MKAFFSLFSGIQGWLIESAGIALVALALFGGGYLKGAADVNEDWAKARSQSVIKAAEVIVEQAAVADRVVTQYVDRVKVIREAGATITKEIPVYVPIDTCSLPGGFRLLHDAAATGLQPEPASPADAAPVPAQTLAATVADNYTRCRETGEQLIALQDWAAKVTKVAP